MTLTQLHQLAGSLTDDASVTLSAKDIRSLAAAITVPAVATPVSENPLAALGDLTVADVAVALKCSRAQARTLVAKKFLKGYRWGKGYRVERAELLRYIEAQRGKAGA